MTNLSVALRTIEADLDTNLALIGWTQTGYLVIQIVMFPAVGKLGDIFGRKRLYVGALLLYSIASFSAGLSPNVYALIACRVVQGMGGATFAVLAVGIISDAFGDKRQTPLGMTASLHHLGAVIGPNVGGAIIDHLSWRWIFFVNAPVGLALVVASLRLIPARAEQQSRQPIDRTGLLFFGAGMVMTLLGLTQWAQHPDDTTSLSIWLLVGAGLASTILFIRHVRVAPSPLIDLNLLRGRASLSAIMINFSLGFGVTAVSFFIPYYTALSYGLSAAQTALILTPRSIAAMIVMPIASMLQARFGYRRPIILGLIFLGLSPILLSLGLHDVSVFGLRIHNVTLLSIECVILGIGIAIVTPASQNAVFDAHPGTRINSVAGLRAMFTQLGSVFGNTTVVLALSHFSDQEKGFEVMFFVMAMVLLSAIPLGLMVQERKRK